MNLSLDNSVNKLVLLLVIGVVVLLIINMNEKKLGKQVSVILSIIVILVCGYFGYMFLNEPEETFINPNESLSPIYEEQEQEQYEHFNNVEPEYEHFADGDVGDGDGDGGGGDNGDSNNGNNVESANNANQPEENKPRDNILNCQELLPADSNSIHAQVAPNNNGDVCTKNLLNAGHHIGVNTTGCSMRNSNRGLRSEPPNPQVQVSPWLQTTICPDVYRRPLE
jgi:hypothetical protein